jgi:hypothetical protein
MRDAASPRGVGGLSGTSSTRVPLTNPWLAHSEKPHSIIIYYIARHHRIRIQSLVCLLLNLVLHQYQLLI